jgi:four helix bundle protein
VCSNVAEGFGRRTHRDFARFLDQARGSLNEIEDLIEDARLRGLLTDEEVGEFDSLVRLTAAPISRLRNYLLTGEVRTGEVRGVRKVR